MCDCIKRLETELTEKAGFKDPSIDKDLLSNKTFSIVHYTEVIQRGKSKGKEKRSNINLFHSHCPWCGEKYDA